LTRDAHPQAMPGPVDGTDQRGHAAMFRLVGFAVLVTMSAILVLAATGCGGEDESVAREPPKPQTTPSQQKGAVAPATYRGRLAEVWETERSVCAVPWEQLLLESDFRRGTEPTPTAIRSVAQKIERGAWDTPVAEQVGVEGCIAGIVYWLSERPGEAPPHYSGQLENVWEIASGVCLLNGWKQLAKQSGYAGGPTKTGIRTVAQRAVENHDFFWDGRSQYEVAVEGCISGIREGLSD